MDKLDLKYFTFDKSQPPQPIRMKVPGWSGSGQKMEDGSEPQPWHCLPFTEGATAGVELVYPYETECHVVNENGSVRFEWEFTKEPGGKLTGGEFVTFFPKQGTKFYLFNTGVDLQSPPGYVIRTEPHPRFYTDETGTVPAAVCGHVQNEWWPKKFFVVFKVPPPGGRHIFRKDDPYVQLLLLPQRTAIELVQMTAQENEARRVLEHEITVSTEHIASNVWHNPVGYPFSNHYKVLSRAFSREGISGVGAAVKEAFAIHQSSLPADKPVSDCLATAYQLLKQEKYRESRAIYLHVLDREPANVEAIARLGVIAACLDVPMVAIRLMKQAVQLEPHSPVYRGNLGEMLRRVGQLRESEAELRTAMQLNPIDPMILSNLGLTLALEGKVAEGVQACRQAIAMAPQLAVLHLRMGQILAHQGQSVGARTYYQAALSIDPTLREAQEAMRELPDKPTAPPQSE